MGRYVVAVDVGTGSARAALVDPDGRLIARAAHPIAMKREDVATAEHSSSDIWTAVTTAVRKAVESAAVDPATIDAIGFDATCSLTFLDRDGQPLSVARDGEPGWDTIAWLDHRAIPEARALSESGSEALRYCGEVLSPEMQLPKIVWVSRHLPDVWARVGSVFDLADFLTWRATGSFARSASTLTAKWNYLNHRGGWDEALLDAAGLPDLPQKAAIVDTPVPAGGGVGRLSRQAASELGLSEACIVSAGMVDAYAGALALAGAEPDEPDSACLIGGTSSCVMRFSQTPVYQPAIWGPYFGASLPGFWISEGGQSAAGALLDHILRSHLGREVTAEDHDAILNRISALHSTQGAALGRNIHVLPDFHGSRTPFADASLLGGIHGLSLDTSEDALAALYFRTKLALALGIRQVVERMEQGFGPIRRLHLGGGHARSPIFAQLYADATGREIVISAGEEAMLLGTAMAAATAAGWHGSLQEACRAMQRRSQTVLHPDAGRRSAYERDYRIFLRMQEHRREILALS